MRDDPVYPFVMPQWRVSEQRAEAAAQRAGAEAQRAGREAKARKTEARRANAAELELARLRALSRGEK